METIFVNIIAPLIVAACTGGFAWLWARHRVQQKIEAAPREFVNEMDRVITRAHQEGPDRAIINGRAIVATRDTLAASLAKVSVQLNSEIDRLATQIGEAPIFERLVRSTVTTQPADPRAVWETIEVLVRMWPAKKKQIEVEIRGILAVLGLDIRSAQR